MHRRVIVIAGLLAIAGQARAQDSVAEIPGGNDALSAYDAQVARYAVDLVPIPGSWGASYVIGPVIKSSRNTDPGYSTNKLIGAAVSPDVLEHVSFPEQGFAEWSTRGAGVNPTENSIPGSTNVGYFRTQFGVACADLGFGPTNITGALVGRRSSEPDRLYVERRFAASSRFIESGDDFSSLSLGSIDAHGDVCIRADSFGIPSSISERVRDENILRVDIADRGASPNVLIHTLGLNVATDQGATTFFVNKSTDSLGPPTMIPSSVTDADEGAPITLDFTGAHRVGGKAQVTDHLDPAIDEHRGPPSYSMLSFGVGDAGTFAFLAISDAGASLRVDSVAAATVDGEGGVVQTISATLPATLTDGSYSADDAEFRGHLSQAAFRGGCGPVAIGVTQSGELRLASTAWSPTDGEFIAVASFAPPVGMSAAQWSVAAHVGKPVFDGKDGQQIGVIASGSQIGSPVSMSAPGMDMMGNVYFVGAYKPNLGAARTAVFKAVITDAGYQLEKLLETGQIVVGANSTRPYEIHSIALGDSDSVASGSIWASSVLQPRRLGAGNNPGIADAFGGLVFSAVIEYDNLAVSEMYDAVLYVGPKGLEGLVGDINGDGVVDTADLGILIAAFGTTDPPSDLNGDGMVDTADLGLLIANFGDTL